MRTLALLALAAGAAATNASAQTQALTLTLLAPDTTRPVHAPVTLIVWRLGMVPDSTIWSFRVNETDLSKMVIRRGREFLIALPSDYTFGAGTHKLTGDVCIFRGPCAAGSATVEVLPPDPKASGAGDTKALLLRTLLEVIRWIVPDG